MVAFLSIFCTVLLLVVLLVNPGHISGVSAELPQPSNERAVASDTRASFETGCVNVLDWPTCDYAHQRWPWSASCEWPRAASSNTSAATIRLIAFLHCCRMVRSPKLRKASLCSLARLSRRSSNRGLVRKAKACAGEKIVLRRWHTSAAVKIRFFRSLGRSTSRSFDMISIGSWHIAVRTRFRRLAASRTVPQRMSLAYAFHEEYNLFDNQLDDRKFLHQGQADHDKLLQVTHDLGHDVRVLQAQQVAANHFC
ncbi:hypothetical protein BDL97_13G102500 [Sphagnum fallax]|nr:hypothetical protein BDL97_13G102500 [Sphagnum fallax]